MEGSYFQSARGSRRCHTFSQHAPMYTSTIGIHRPDLQEFTLKIRQFHHGIGGQILGTNPNAHCMHGFQQFNWLKLGRCTIWSHGSVHSSTIVSFKKKKSPWNFHGEGHLSAPDLGLASSNFPCDSRIKARLPTELSVCG